MPAVPRPRWLLAVSLVALSLATGVSQPALAAPSVEGVIEAQGTATTFRFFGAGLALEGGTHDWSYVCGGCELRVTFSIAETFVVVQNGRVQTFSHGAFAVRDFSGLIQVWEEGPGQFMMQIHGVGSAAPL